MKILIIGPTVFALPLAGYGGLEEVIYRLGVGLQKKGHQVAMVAPAGSKLPEGMELIEVGQREAEESAFGKYRERMESGEWDVICDSTWEAWCYISVMEHGPEFPIVHIVHAYPYFKPPPVQHPCFIGLSNAHCRELRLMWGIDLVRVYNGVDLDYYTLDASVKRTGRYLWLARYLPEKGPIVAINLARKLRLHLDCVGDTEIVTSAEYVDQCRNACDGLMVRFMPGVSREETVKLYRSHKALLFPLQWSEPFGLTVIEASACGMPALVLRRGAMPELVEHGRNGFVFDSEEAMEEGLRRGVVEHISPQDCREVAEKFSLERMVNSYESLFTRVAEGYRW